MQEATLDVLTRLGASAEDFTSFDFKKQKTCIQYGNLVRAQRHDLAHNGQKIDSIFLGAAGVMAYIVEFRQRNATRESRSEWLAGVHKKLMSCGDAAMMVVVDGGWVEVFPLQQRYSPDSGAVIELSPANALFFRSMALGCLPDVLTGRPEWSSRKLNVVDEFSRLITNTVYHLGAIIDQNFAYILTVKAVLIRLLVERRLCADGVLAGIDFKQPFATWEQAASSLAWLNDVLGFVDPTPINQPEFIDVLRKSYVPTGGVSAANPLESIFNETTSINPRLLDWGDFDLGYAQLVQLAEAFQRAHSILFMAPGTRKNKPAVSAELSIFMAAESINCLDSNPSRILITTAGCGQLPVRALTQMAVAHCYPTLMDWPELVAIERLASENLRCNSTDPILEYVATALVRITAFDLCKESYPVSRHSKSDLRPELLFQAHNSKPEIVIGDYSEAGHSARSVTAICSDLCLPDGIIAVSIPNKFVSEKFVRIPPSLRENIQLTGIASGIATPGRSTLAAVIVAKNTMHARNSEFWFSVPYTPKFGIGIGHNWVDLANTTQVSQLLLNSMPELPSVLTRLSLPESAVLIRVWRTLSETSADFELTEASLTQFCHSLIRNSVVGQFILKALTGETTTSRKLPIERLKTLTPSVRALAGRVMDSGVELSHPEAAMLIETLCAIDRTDISIMDRFLAGQGAVQLSHMDFANQLQVRLAPFFNEDTFFVIPRNKRDGSQSALFMIGNKWANEYERLDIGKICERIASVPVSSKNYVPLDDGRLILLLRRERLNQAEVDVVAIEILRDFANAIEKEDQWQND